jgi:hypothetical protein
MARRTFDLVDIIEILVHWHAGRSNSEIAQSLDVDVPCQISRPASPLRPAPAFLTGEDSALDVPSRLARPVVEAGFRQSFPPGNGALSHREAAGHTPAPAEGRPIQLSRRARKPR